MQFTVRQIKTLCMQLSVMLNVNVEYAPVHHDNENDYSWINCPHGYEHRIALRQRGVLPQFEAKQYRLREILQLRGEISTITAERCRIVLCPICGGYILVG